MPKVDVNIIMKKFEIKKIDLENLIRILINKIGNKDAGVNIFEFY